MSNVVTFPRRNLRSHHPYYVGSARQVEGRIAILETIAKITVRDSAFTPYEQAALLAKLRTAIRAECVAHKLSPDEQFETMRYAERLLDDILDSIHD
ncbi:hypothetical protein LVY75_20805 [Sinorhizobium sp. B11]|jgi:hypothetical protein|uniref:hypothetical protein n=1 Tax=unclassified Rhizobium TaxID=2613769 RepID=UPI000DD62441|nr:MULTISPECIES: hypothetical protein [unclassified Rhizobium]MBB3440876.1 hypothetical protein [Rhizobium sp. BK379]MBB3560209.1 hypothetical protein [Rhizobium sp. BK512]